MVSESDDYSTHLQVDATPRVAAKTLRRTRKRNGSTQDLSKVGKQDCLHWGSSSHINVVIDSGVFH